MKSYDRIAAIFFLAVGGFFSLYARRVKIGTWNEPEAGFLPFWGGLLLVGMSVFLLLSTFKAPDSPVRMTFFPVAGAWKRVLVTFLSLAAYNLLLNRLGFTLTTFLFLGFLVRFIFPQGWRRTLLVAFIGSVIARLLFINFLETQLPIGILGF
ncbi:MAG: tripartite tricarboxylate transporter TctB family protein [Thermodesulfobacteriota bacterium]